MDDTTNMKMAGTPGNVFTGTDHCGAYKNALGIYEERKVSTICWISIVIVVLAALSTAQGGYKILQQADALKPTLKLFYGNVVNFDKLVDFLKIAAYVTIIAAILTASVTYYHCTRCNGGVAFFKMIGISIVSYAIVKFLWNRTIDETVDETELPQETKDGLKTILRSQL